MNIEVYSVGRGEADIHLEDPEKTTSKMHAELTVSASGALYLVDCGSANGTQILKDGRWVRIKQDVVTPDSVIRFGACQVRLSDVLPRLVQRPPAQSVQWQAPLTSVTLRPVLNAETGDREWK